MQRKTGELAIENLDKRYGDFVAVRRVDLTVEPGRLVALLGPSGCGKTTILRAVAGLIRPDGGAVRIDGVDQTGRPPWRRDVGLVFQNYALFPHMSVAENVAFGLKMRRLPRAEIETRVAGALAMVRMSDFAARRPSQLSGGQQQRVAVARALVVEPRVLLLDEPLAALDAKLRDSMRLELRALQRDLGITTILVTHDQSEAFAMADRIAVMNAGRIEQVGEPETIYRQPASRFVAEFVGEMNVLRGTGRAEGGLWRLAGEGGSIAWPGAEGLRQGAVQVLVRPEHVAIAPADDGAATENGSMAGRVQAELFSGDRLLTLVESPFGDIKVIRPSASGVRRFAAGEAVTLSFAHADMRVLADE
ncbi:MAG: ABC transporter ATP-binding protein [Alphaproteobacteria bacterium]|nr:ABC transporter ATP-binding protein [Alphaproteobacteria bacterium]